ncbi:DUF6491 family protein [Aurantiacibacter aquimixticola]|uniref:Lipoprotein n=1 Tax=Aurantiacibacter aquimixticola TaxID=1958945 RepID=A0A419RW07_9SPHN|nr:DUF6491 family protein [Aurantiacibacter aquimixticola]RJY09947.1 hypothetical protein D6201_11850 [Aurantiacibacter aquimixticola]
MIRIAMPIAATLALTACAQTPPAESAQDDPLLAQLDTSRSCFIQREVRGYSAAPDAAYGRQRIFLDTGLDERFVLETTGPCPELDFSLRAALSQRTIGSICTGDLETLIVPSRIAQDFGQCPVRVLGRVPKD